MAACASPASDWETAKYRDSHGGYIDFLDSHPQSEFASMAKEQLNRIRLEWQALDAEEERRRIRAEWDSKSTHGEAGIINFLEKYPSSEISDMARAELRRYTRGDAWKSAKQRDTFEAYEEYLSNYPDSGVTEEATGRMEELARKPFFYHAKSGDLDYVKLNCEVASLDQKSEALMISVWGALHTSLDYKISNGNLRKFVKRTAPAERKVYVAIIQVLLDSGADPEMYNFLDFGGVVIREYESAQRLEVSLEDGVLKVEGLTRNGGPPNVLLGKKGVGRSALRVAEIVGASDIVDLLITRASDNEIDGGGSD